eukprot:gene7124-7928_t
MSAFRSRQLCHNKMVSSLVCKPRWRRTQLFHTARNSVVLESQNRVNNNGSNPVKDIHLVDENGKSHGIMSLQNAELQAKSNDLQLQLVKAATHNSPHAVYKLFSKKDLYELHKKSKEKERNLQKSQPKPKELSISTDIAGQDLNWKVKKIEEFLVENHRVKVIINKKWRSKTDLKTFFESILDKMKNFGEIDGNVVQTERRIRFVLKPVKA